MFSAQSEIDGHAPSASARVATFVRMVITTTGIEPVFYADTVGLVTLSSINGILARGVRVSTADTGVPPMSLSPFPGSPPGVSRATSAIIAPGK
jgi:hypothetical protein